MTTPNTPRTVDTDELATLFDGRWAHIRANVREELTHTDLAPNPESDTEQQRARTLEQLHLLSKSGVQELGFPREHGGQDDPGGSVVSLEMLPGNLSLMVKAGVQWGLFGGAVLALGTERHHQRYLRDIMSLDLLGCFAMTEHGHGSDVQSLGTTANYDPHTEEFVVHTPDDAAAKEFIGNAARDGHAAVVFAQLHTPDGNAPDDNAHGVHALLVPLRDRDGNTQPGVHIEDCGHKAGLNGVDNGTLSFDNVRVPRENLLNQYGDVAADGTYTSPIDNPNKRFFTMLGTLIRGRISVAGSAGQATKLALEIALRYGEHRSQFENPTTGREVTINDYLGHQRKLLPALAKTCALHFAQEQLVSTMHDLRGKTDPTAQRQLEADAAGLKALTTWHATHTIQTCREACGGSGYLTENQLGQLKADTDVFTTFEGDNTVLLQLVAKGLLTQYKDQFEALGTLGTARFIAEEFVGTITERSATRNLVRRLINGGRDSCYDRGWQLTQFEEREKHILDGLAKRLRRTDRNNAFDAFNNAQDHVLLAARAHLERVVLEAFVGAIDRCRDANTRTLLERVCDLYALSTIESERGWFLEHERMSPRRSKEVIEAVNTLCQQLRPHAVDIVRAFGVPRQWVTAPITERG